MTVSFRWKAVAVGGAAIVALLIARSVPAGQPVAAGYGHALHGANQFLHAWLERDDKGGRQLLSSRLRNGLSEDQWFNVMVGTSNPHHEAFEISGGQRLSDGRYTFPVKLYDHYEGESTVSCRQSSLVLLRTSGEDWRVDKLP